MGDTEKSNSSGTSSDLNAVEFNKVDMLNEKRELEYDRMGVSTIAVKHLDCSKAKGTTNDVCMFKRPGHTMILGAQWDRPLVSKTSK